MEKEKSEKSENDEDDSVVHGDSTEEEEDDGGRWVFNQEETDIIRDYKQRKEMINYTVLARKVKEPSAVYGPSDSHRKFNFRNSRKAKRNQRSEIAKEASDVKFSERSSRSRVGASDRVTRSRTGLRSQAEISVIGLRSQALNDGIETINHEEPVLRVTAPVSPVVLIDSTAVNESPIKIPNSKQGSKDLVTHLELSDPTDEQEVEPLERSDESPDSLISGTAEITKGNSALRSHRSSGQKFLLSGPVAASGRVLESCTPAVCKNAKVTDCHSRTPIAGASPDLNSPIDFPNLESYSGALSRGHGKGVSTNSEAGLVGHQQEASPVLSSSFIRDSLAVGGSNSQGIVPGRILPATLVPGTRTTNAWAGGERQEGMEPAAKGGGEAITWSSLLTKGQKIDGNPLSYYPPIEEGIAEIPEEVLVEGCALWDNTLIGYVVGKRPYYEYLRINLLKAWKPRGNVTILTLEKGFFLFQFENLEDRRLVLEDGPWRIGGKPLVVKAFDRYCEFVREEFSTLPVWVRIPNLDPRLWTNAAISRVASCIGKPLSIDAATSTRSRLSFARVCVEVDPFKPLPTLVHVRTPFGVFPQPVEYDWKPDPCLECRSIHHNQSNCPKRPPPPKATIGGPRPNQFKPPAFGPIQPSMEKVGWKVVQKNPKSSGPTTKKGTTLDRSNKFALLADKGINPVENDQGGISGGCMGSFPNVRKEIQTELVQAGEARPPITTSSGPGKIVSSSGGAVAAPISRSNHQAQKANPSAQREDSVRNVTLTEPCNLGTLNLDNSERSRQSLTKETTTVEDLAGRASHSLFLDAGPSNLNNIGCPQKDIGSYLIDPMQDGRPLIFALPVSHSAGLETG